MSKHGIFITFEGPDGAGKSTQIRLLAERLSSQGIEVILTREPGGTAISNRIREILLDPTCEEMAPMTEVLLYAASRAQHAAEKIRPALDKGCLILCDRYIDASIAYQSAGLGVSPEFVRTCSEQATNGLWPDRTYLIDVPVDTGLSRVASREGQPDRIEARNGEYHKSVRQEFLRIAQQDADRVILIDGTQTIEEISEEIWKDCSTILKDRG